MSPTLPARTERHVRAGNQLNYADNVYILTENRRIFKSEKPESRSSETHGFPTVALLPAFLHGRTGVLPTPLPFDSGQNQRKEKHQIIRIGVFLFL